MLKTLCISEMLTNLIKKYNLPKKSIYISENRSSKTNKLNGYSVNIFEPSYPAIPDEPVRQSKNILTIRPIREDDWSVIELRMLADQEKDLASYLPPDSERVNPLPAIDVTAGFVRVRMRSTSPNLVKYICTHTEYCIKNYSTKAQGFGCCGFYLECSNAKHCIHENMLYSTACAYRKNLEQNKIFYGMNKNI